MGLLLVGVPDIFRPHVVGWVPPIIKRGRGKRQRSFFQGVMVRKLIRAIPA